MKKPPTWAEVARRPKWIGGFFIAMLVAALCAGFSQWQAGRSIEQPVHTEEINSASIAKAPMIDEVIRPGRAPKETAVGTLVRAEATLDTSKVWVVGNRVQKDGTSGFWVVAFYTDGKSYRFAAPLGFTKSRKNALAVAQRIEGSLVPQVLLPMHGRLSPSEPPQALGTVLQSLSLGQLANLNGEAGYRTYPLFLLVTTEHVAGLENIEVTRMTTAQINWLSAFYAAEWAAFCGLSFFMWWRLVRDEQEREIAEMEAE